MSSPPTSPSGLRRPAPSITKAKTSGIPSPSKPTGLGSSSPPRSPHKKTLAPAPTSSPSKQSSLLPPAPTQPSISSGCSPPPSPSKSNADNGRTKRTTPASVSPKDKQMVAKSSLKKLSTTSNIPSPQASKFASTKPLTSLSSKHVATSPSPEDLELALRQKDDAIAELTAQSNHYREEAESLANQVLAWKGKHDEVAALLEESMEVLATQGVTLNREGMVNEDNRDHLAQMHEALALVTFDKHLLAEKYWAMQESVAVAQDASTSKGKIQQLKEKLAAKQQTTSARRLEGVGLSLARGVLQREASSLNQSTRPFATSFGVEVHLDDVANAWQWLNQHMSYKNNSS